MGDERKLWIVRHAHRDTDKGRERDNGLSDRGYTQSEMVCRFLERKLADKRFVIYSSPKVRCMETLLPLSKRRDVPVQETNLLVERGESEPASTWNKRLAQFVENWRQGPDKRVVACCHGDWIEDFFPRVLNLELSLKKGAVALLREEESRLQLRWVIQDFEWTNLCK